MKVEEKYLEKSESIANGQTLRKDMWGEVLCETLSGDSVNSWSSVMNNNDPQD